MAQKGVQLDRETVSCSICLDLLTDPVTAPCGHSFCTGCIKTHWDKEDEGKAYRCPQCKQTFAARPVLVPNTMVAFIVEELKKVGLHAAPGDRSDAGPEDVACDVCTGRKQKACKSCLVCLISFCDQHVQPHYESPAFAKHKLVEPSKKLQENICPRHDEVMKMFCRTDLQSICYLCPADDHKGHDTVSAAAERTEKQKELEVRRQNVQERIQEREEDVKVLEQEVEAINASAFKAVEDSERMFTELVRLMEKRHSDLRQQVRAQQEAEVHRVRELQAKMKQEIAELKRNDAELQRLSRAEDPNQFLHDFHKLGESPPSSRLNIRPLRYFTDVTVALSEVRDKLQDVLREDWTNVSHKVAEVDALLSQPELMTRHRLKEYSRDITLDPNTASEWLLLSDGKQKATLMCRVRAREGEINSYHHQVLSAESLTGCCYWEVEWRGHGVSVVVAYKKYSAQSLNETAFGNDDRSWLLYCDKNSYNFWHNKVLTPIPGPSSSRVGVYLDQSAGILAFYSVSKTMTLLHRIQTTFTQPLCAGLRFDYFIGSSAKFC